MPEGFEELKVSDGFNWKAGLDFDDLVLAGFLPAALDKAVRKSGPIRLLNITSSADVARVSIDLSGECSVNGSSVES